MTDMQAEITEQPGRAAAADPTGAQAALRLDDFEAGLLPVLRHFLNSLEVPERQGWQHAYHTAAERWGESFGLAVAYTLFTVLRAVADVRPSRLACQDALCLETRSSLTADEAALLRMIHHMRRDQTASARQAVAAVTGGRMDPQVIRAGLAFARRFPCGGGRAGPSARPVLRAVG